MVGFLVKRPVAVTMAFLGIMVLGMVAATYLPVSLVPDVDIPRISVKVNAPQYAARELEGRVMERLRMHLMQVNGLRDIKTESRDGSGLVSLEFEFGTSIDLAYIEVNEQVDKASAGLPRDLSRPSVVKASASDIPVFYLDIHHGQSASANPRNSSSEDFLALSAFADEIIRRRIEQIPQVAMADMSGRAFPEIIIAPHMDMLHSMNMPPETIENLIRANNVTLGNIMIRDKQYQYNVRVGSPYIQAEDIGNLWLSHQGRLWQLKELCSITYRPREDEGAVYSNGNRTVTMAIIKQADARMQDLKQELHGMVSQLRNDYPHLQFTIYRDQTALLDYTIDNLRQTLWMGAILAFVVMFLFLRDVRSPWLIVISVPAAMVISLLFFYMVGISINIVSLSGLILCVGMMIDNSIIVIDNIARHRHQGTSLYNACVNGTNEVFRPMLSSVLTTCSVFIPLIFLGGLPGALFFDQAMAVSIGLLVSLVIAVTLLPVYYHLLFKNHKLTSGKPTKKGLLVLDYPELYNKGFRFTMRRQPWVWAMFLLLLLCVPVMAGFIGKEQLPQVRRQAALMWIDWNENIHLDENYRRTALLLEREGGELNHITVQAGRQQFLMENLHNSHRRQSLVYLAAPSPEALLAFESATARHVARHYPSAILHFEDEGNLFDQIFGSGEAPLQVRLRPLQAYGSQMQGHIIAAIDKLSDRILGLETQPVPLQEIIVLQPDLRLMALYQVEMAALQRALARIFNENQIIALMDNRSTIPVKVVTAGNDVQELLRNERVTNRQGIPVPLSLLLSTSRSNELQTITAGLEGEYYPLDVETLPLKLSVLRQTIDETLKEQGLFEASYAGSVFARASLVRELLLIGSVALLLLFFILAAQFESLRLPIIVLMEVPVAMSGALLMLIIFGATLNVMSMIGLVVMTGIIINDSILKIDTINRLRSSGMPLLRALHTAGHYRLKPILMTSVTTIFALLPFLFVGGLGGELQKPLALTVIGGLGLGTLVSLYFVPLMYYYLYVQTVQTTSSRQTFSEESRP